jgi:hypothetical protein
MSAPNQTHKPRGPISSRANNAWRNIHSAFVRSGEGHNLPVTNLPINPDRNPFSLAKVRHLPSAQEMCVDVFCGCQASDGQIATNPRNYSSTVYAISNEQVSKDIVALIEYQ